MYLIELIEKNGDRLVRYNDKTIKADKTYMSVFDYSEKHGGTYDSLKYYNDYYVELA